MVEVARGMAEVYGRTVEEGGVEEVREGGVGVLRRQRVRPSSHTAPLLLPLPPPPLETDGERWESESGNQLHAFEMRARRGRGAR